MKIKPKLERPYPSEHSCRLESPDKYDRFARKNCAVKSDGKCIDHIYGIKAGKSELQAMRYSKSIWDAGAAGAHCRSHGGSFEAASGSKSIFTGLLTRNFEIDIREIDKEKRLVPLSFSSEEPVERFFGTEILDHDPKSIRMERLGKGIPVLVNHDRDQQVGILESPSIGSDRKGRGMARFGQSPLALQIFQDIQDGIRKDTSVGYQIHKMILAEEKEEQKVYRATDWEPMEVSIVPVPADITVGIDRGEGNEYEIVISNMEEKIMEDDLKQESKITQDIEKTVKEAEERARLKESNRTSEIMAMGQRAGLLDDAMKYVSEGKPVDSFRQHVLETAMQKIDSKIVMGDNRAEKEPFKNFGEYLYCVRFHVDNPRLRPLSAERILGERAMSMGVGTAGGFAVPEQFGAMLREVPPEEALFRMKSFVVPAGDPPDAKITFPAIDIGTTHGRLGGFEGAWIAEGERKTEANLFLREISLEPQEYAARLIATDKLLRNWSAASSVIERMARQAIISAEELAFISGNGVGKPLGILSAANTAAISVTRAGATAIVWADVYNMYRRVLRQGGGAPFFVTSSSCLSQLILMKDDGSSLVWQPNAREGLPVQMLGYPLYINDRLPALGTKGDFMLLNLNPYYYIKDGSGPFFSASEHVYFEYNRTVFKIFWLVDGQPALKEAIPVEGNTAAAYTVSPFVILN